MRKGEEVTAGMWTTHNGRRAKCLKRCPKCLGLLKYLKAGDSPVGCMDCDYESNFGEMVEMPEEGCLFVTDGERI